MNQNNIDQFDHKKFGNSYTYNPNIELSTPISSLGDNNDIDVSNFVKKVENNIENLNNTNQNNILKMNGYEYQHNQMINQQNPILRYQVNKKSDEVVEESDEESYEEKKISTSSNTSFLPFSRESIIFVLIYTLLTHRRVNQAALVLFPKISDPKYYTIYTIIKGIIFSILVNCLHK